MKFQRPHCTEGGFTLLELVVVIVLLGVTSTAVIRLNGGLFKNGSSIRDLQSDTQLLQACAEQVMASRRLGGFDDTPDYDAACEALPVATKADNNNFDVTTTLNYNGSSCPVGATCQLVDIKAHSTSGTIGPLTLLLMKY
jgi:prepilin-type N-terminal cleavage/methylation domain-containing protein